MDRFVSFLFAASLLNVVLLGACDGEKLPGEEGLEREELGTFTTDTGGGVDLTFAPAEGSVSALVYCGPYTSSLATAETITAPDGSGVYDMEDPTGTPMRVGVHSDILPVLIPVSPELDLAAGDYGMRVYFDAEDAVSVTCNAVYRTSAVESPATIDIELVFVGVDGIAPGLNEAEGEDTMAAVLDTVGTLWSGAGLEIGTVTYADFGGSVDTYSVINDDAELGDLLSTVSTDNERTVTFFFVQDITTDEGATILGLAGGPPGTAAVGGTSKSGVVVNAASFTSDPDEIARIMAHEGGHFLGLFHTTEKDGSSTDPLSDTPECSTDTDGNGTYSTTECEGTGADNVMWWAASESSTDMSDDQGWVIGRSAAVY